MTCERVRNRTPSGASSENPLPRPSTTSTTSLVWRHASYWLRDIQNVTGSSTPASSASSTSEPPVRNSPAG
jgi:hypothetical protein